MIEQTLTDVKSKNETQALSAFYHRHEIDDLLSTAWLKITERMNNDYLTALDAIRADTLYLNQKNSSSSFNR